MVAEEIDRLGVALSRGVEDRGLLERILFDRIHAELDENFDHSKSKVFVRDDSCMENRCLTEIFGLIEDKFHINGRLADQANHFVNISSLNFIENGLVERTWLSRLL